MRKVLASLKPYYYYLVGEGIKKIEVRKDMPKASDWDNEVLFYMSKDEKSFAKIPKEFQEKYRKHFGKVGMQFICDKVDEYPYDYCDGVDIDDDTILETAIDREDINIYAKGKTLYGWHISDLKIYDRPRELSDFYRECEKPCKPNKGKILCITTKSLKMNGCNGKIPLTRAPQSWQYIEDLGEEE